MRAIYARIAFFVLASRASSVTVANFNLLSSGRDLTDTLEVTLIRSDLDERLILGFYCQFTLIESLAPFPHTLAPR